VRNILMPVRSIILSYAEVFFLKGLVIGVLVLCITLLNPALGIAGFISISVAYAFALFVGYEREFLKSGYYTYNALLVGLSIGQLFAISPLTILFISIAAIITFMVTVSMSDVLHKYFALPILSAPFVIVTSLIYLSAAKFTNLYVSELYAAGHVNILSDVFPYWINGFLRSLGAILFMPSPAIGLFLLGLILFHSRVLFLLAIIGYYFGISLQGAFVGSYRNAFYDLNAFNYPLIAMALGGIFNIPSVKSYTFALTGVAMATVLIKSIDIFWAEYGIPVFTLPFLLITLGYIYVLNLLQYKYRPFIYKDSPEETAEYFYTQESRYSQVSTMYLPFKDSWSVYQGFDGEWTHKGIWKYAYDFVIKNKKGFTYENEGKNLEDYFCYKKSITSPCKGVVAYTSDIFPDNPIGVVDTFNNWGNFIVIKDYRGFYVGLCHLALGSILVKPGDWVDIFQDVALCGNSGYSPQPHIHIQCQSTSFLSSVTLPFSFVGLKTEKNIYHHLIPKKDVVVAPIFIDDYYYQVTNFVLDECLHYKVYRNDRFIEDIVFKVKMGIDSTFYLSRNNSRLYFGRSDSTFYFYHLEGNDKYLRMLYQALPSFPMSYNLGFPWNDIVPVKFIKGWKQRIMLNVKNMFKFGAQNNAEYEFKDDTTIVGNITSGIMHKKIKTKVVLDPYLKFSEFEFDNTKFIADQS
jgi:urea transporter